MYSTCSTLPGDTYTLFYDFFLPLPPPTPYRRPTVTDWGEPFIIQRVLRLESHRHYQQNSGASPSTGTYYSLGLRRSVPLVHFDPEGVFSQSIQAGCFSTSPPLLPPPPLSPQ